MKRDTIKRIDAFLVEFPFARASDTPPEAEIAQAEREIGVPFSSDYRQFLLRYGGAIVGAYSIFGLRPVEEMGEDRWSVVDVTRQYRALDIEGTDDWAIVSEDQAGNPIGMAADGTIWINDHDFGGVAFLEKTLDDYLRWTCLRLPRKETG